ncbi:MAG: hypothetical protein IKG87_13260 [Clostridia bacterium]|nr:hypothetical protein [Clostridia bacterium]
MTGYSYAPGEPLMLTLCLEEDSILVSRAILETLQHPKQVQMLINEERQMLLLQACTVDDREAVVIPPDTLMQFEMSGHSLLKRIRRLTGWNDNKPRVIYGNFIPSHNAIVFDLHLAQLAKLQIPLDRPSGKPS